MIVVRNTAAVSQSDKLLLHSAAFITTAASRQTENNGTAISAVTSNMGTVKYSDTTNLWSGTKVDGVPRKTDCIRSTTCRLSALFNELSVLSQKIPALFYTYCSTHALY